MLTLERKPVGAPGGTLTEADRARLHGWLAPAAARRGPAEPATTPSPSNEPAPMRWIPLAVPLLAVMVAATMALIWGTVLA